jgi:uncharacterized protein YlxP (DUF503 family)
MVVVISVFELHIPEGRSLKQKRRVIKGIMERIHHRYRVSIAETDFHDLHQRAEIAIAAVHGSRTEMERMLQGIRNLVEETPGTILLAWEPQYLESVG